jgi:hypothetical protein
MVVCCLDQQASNVMVGSTDCRQYKTKIVQQERNYNVAFGTHLAEAYIVNGVSESEAM